MPTYHTVTAIWAIHRPCRRVRSRQEREEKDRILVSVTPLKQKIPGTSGDALFQATVRDLAANELVFAVVGPVGSGTSEIAEALNSPLTKSNDSDSLGW